jgi:hypothetical protein
MTIVTLTTLRQAVQDVVGGITGIRMAPDEPDEAVPISDVTGYCSARAGHYEQTTSDGIVEATHQLHLDILTPRRHYRTDNARLKNLIDTVALVLLGDTTLGGLVLDMALTDYTYGTLPWGGQDMLAWQFELTVRVTGTVT